jgi:hypothetical protein
MDAASEATEQDANRRQRGEAGSHGVGLVLLLFAIVELAWLAALAYLADWLLSHL